MISPVNSSRGYKYGSREHFKVVFEDYIGELSDVGIDPDAMLLGMMDAIIEMIDYHENAVARYVTFSSKIKQLLSDEYDEPTAQDVGLTSS